MQGSVVAADVPFETEFGWQLDDLGRFQRRVPLVGMAQGLIVNVLVGVPLGFDEGDDVGVSQTGQVCGP